MSENFIPTEEDVLRSRVRTTGYIEYSYEIGILDKHTFNVSDHGGERNERKKWIHSFYNVDCILYVTGLQDYCKSLFECEKQISLLESIQLFNFICNYKWFKRTVIVVLLNKIDLFKEYLKITPLTFCFGNEYKGRNFNDNIDIHLYILGNDDDDKYNIPIDIVNIIVMYFYVIKW